MTAATTIEAIEEARETYPDEANREDVDRRNGIVRKDVVQEGEGLRKPLYNHQVTFHYEARRADDGTIFDSSRERGAPIQILLDQGRALPGVEAAILTMREKEKAVFEIDSAKAFGVAGCGKDVPPDTNVLFEIELLGFSEKEREMNDMNGEELLLLAQDSKTEGNRLLKMGRYDDALVCYKKGCEVMKQDQMKIMDDVMEIEFAIRLNMSLVFLHLQRYREAKDEAEVVLKRNKDNPKAKYRHALAQMGLGFLEEARTELFHLAKEDPKNKEIRATLEQCKLKLVESKKKENEMFGSMFNSATTGAPEPHTTPIIAEGQRESGSQGAEEKAVEIDETKIEDITEQ